MQTGIDWYSPCHYLTHNELGSMSSQSISHRNAAQPLSHGRLEGKEDLQKIEICVWNEPHILLPIHELHILHSSVFLFHVCMLQPRSAVLSLASLRGEQVNVTPVGNDPQMEGSMEGTFLFWVGLRLGGSCGSCNLSIGNRNLLFSSKTKNRKEKKMEGSTTINSSVRNQRHGAHHTQKEANYDEAHIAAPSFLKVVEEKHLTLSSFLVRP